VLYADRAPSPCDNSGQKTTCRRDAPNNTTSEPAQLFQHSIAANKRRHKSHFVTSVCSSEKMLLSPLDRHDVKYKTYLKVNICSILLQNRFKSGLNAKNESVFECSLTVLITFKAAYVAGKTTTQYTVAAQLTVANGLNMKVL